MSAFRTHAKIVGDVLMHLIDTTACVLMASLASTVKPTLMNACQPLVFTEGTGPVSIILNRRTIICVEMTWNHF